MKQSSKKHELGTAALYCRLSRDDNMDSEADIIIETRKGVALSYPPGTGCSMNFVGNKKTECPLQDTQIL